MIDKKDLFIRIIDATPDMKYRVEHTDDGDILVHEKPENEWKDETVAQGGITINNRLIKFYLSLKEWKLLDYIQQWDEGISRLEKNDRSCLVVDIDKKEGSCYGAWWTLYKVNDEIYMQYHVFNEHVEHAVLKGLFTPETCYNFIPSRETHEDDGEEISELIVGEYDDFDDTESVLANNKGILIKVINSDYREDSVLCRIFIGNDLYETFEVITNCCWNFHEYIAQWKEGLERLRTHDVSCLVLAASDADCGHFVNWWLLYKKNGIVYLHNQILLQDIYEEIVGKEKFTAENCYDFIPVGDASRTSSVYVQYDDLSIY